MLYEEINHNSVELFRNTRLAESIFRIQITGVKEMVFPMNQKPKEAEKKLFHFFINAFFYIIFSVIDTDYFRISSTVNNCAGTCGTFSETYFCRNQSGCESLSNPRQTVAGGESTTLSNIPCRFTIEVVTNCPP